VVPLCRLCSLMSNHMVHLIPNGDMVHSEYPRILTSGDLSAGLSHVVPPTVRATRTIQLTVPAFRGGLGDAP